MASQIIHCPPHLLVPIPTGMCRLSPDDPGLSIETQGRTVCIVSLDPRLAWDHRPPYGHRTLALALVPNDENDFSDEPQRLPDDLVVPVIDVVAAHAMPHLTGHDGVEFGALLDVAKRAPNAPPGPKGARLPRTRFERRLCEAALQLERQWSKVLEDLDHYLASYGEQLHRCGLGPIITGLATEAPVVDLLALAPDISPSCYQQVNRPTGWHLAIAEAMRESHAARHATWWTMMELKSAGTYPRGDVTQDTFEELFRFGAASPIPEWGQRLWRRNEIADADHPALVPACGVASAMLHLTTACDRRLLGHRHAAVRAALIVYAFMRVRPFGSSDRRAAELVFNLLLRQSDVPPLPLLMATHRKTLDMTAALQSAAMRRRPDVFVEAAISLVTEALAIGQRMIEPMQHEHWRLLAALIEAGFDKAAAADAAAALLSNVLTPVIRDGIELQNVECIERQARHLHAIGLVDIVRAGRNSWWSSALARALACGKSSIPVS